MLYRRVRTKSMSYDIGTTKGADVYFKPEIVWEVAATVFEQSSEYPAAKGSSRLYLYLEFPTHDR